MVRGNNEQQNKDSLGHLLGRRGRLSRFRVRGIRVRDNATKANVFLADQFTARCLLNRKIHTFTLDPGSSVHFVHQKLAEKADFSSLAY